MLYGDVARPSAMTVPGRRYAQSLTDKPMKGMLTGPVTILQWSFVRDDQPRRETCRRSRWPADEVLDLEAAGCGVIQVDEPALREGLRCGAPTRTTYLRWATDASASTVARRARDTQVHTHMCYAEFGDIMERIARSTPT